MNLVTVSARIEYQPRQWTWGHATIDVDKIVAVEHVFGVVPGGNENIPSALSSIVLEGGVRIVVNLPPEDVGVWLPAMKAEGRHKTDWRKPNA